MLNDPVPSRSAVLAAQLAQATTDLLATAEACDTAQWHTRCANEERAVGVLVHHVAINHAVIQDLVERVVTGQPAPPLTQESIDHANARHAAVYANVAADPTIALLRQNGAAAIAYIGTLTDADLEQAAQLPLFGAQAITAQLLIEYLLIGHTLGHLASITAALLRE